MRGVRRGVVVAVALMGLVLAAGVDASALDEEPPQARRASAPSGTHPFGDPRWYPLRTSDLDDVTNPPANPGPWSSLVSCVFSNCPHVDGNYHNYWAIDFVGDEGDPIFAAGAGVFHRGGVETTCTAAGPASRGTWGWIDHGGGTVSRYHHLDRFRSSLATGDLVSVGELIAYVGHTNAKCSNVNYLHFEVRRGGLYGPTYNPGQLRACVGGNRVLLPRAVDDAYHSWNDLEWRRVGMPRTYSGCIPAVPGTPDRPASTRGQFGDRRATVTWPGPTTPVDRVTLSAQIFRPTTGRFSEPTYVTRGPDVRSHTFTGLTNARRYRYRVAYHGAEGYSGWGPAVEVVPATVPTRPTKKWIYSGAHRIGYGWNASRANGRPVTGYQVAIRRAAGTGWTDWQATRIPLADGARYVWEGLLADRTYQVRVRATSAAGPSPWSSSSTIKTLQE